jgi:acetyl-CoA carboxylase biotin carboxyl carrier protein
VELKQIKDLMAAMGRNGTKKIILKKEGFELTLERGDAQGYVPAASAPSLEENEENPMRGDMEMHRAQAFLRGTGKLAQTAIPPEPAPVATNSPDDAKSLFITSPMVGTFYAATAPEDPPFVKPGSRVEKSTVVCIVEAMKVMNEVKAGVAGTIAEVLIDNGQPIEFGSKLFRVIP